MINTVITIRRGSGLWGGVSPETVKRYREELEELKKKISDFSFLYERNLFGSSDLKRALDTEIDQEIKYCLFYDEYLKRQTEPNFNEWVLRKQEEINLNKENWQKVPGDQWTKTNGRIKAIIQFDKTGIMTKIALDFKNDSDSLKFYEGESSYRKSVVPIAHLKSEASIEARVQDFKNEADTFLNEHLNPLYSQYEAELLKQLIHL